MANVITNIEQVGGNGVSYPRRAILHTDGSYSFDSATPTLDGALPITRQHATLDLAPVITAVLPYAAGDQVGQNFLRSPRLWTRPRPTSSLA